MSIDAPILETKISPPRVRGGLVHRRRLLRRMDEGTHKPLTLISAPAGFGKTTLLGDWIRSGAGHVAWLSLDEGDNDLGRFLIHLVAALRLADERVGEGLLEGLSAAELPPETVLTRIVNDVAGLDEDLVLVLDDHHLLRAEPIRSALDFLLEHRPERLHVVLAGRADPALPLSRLRAQDEVTEIRAADLRFTEAEAAEFLNGLMHLGLSAADIATLEARTEGWIASLQLAALSLRGREDAPAFVSEFSGSHRHVIDYLVDEVLSRQPADVQAFLRRTAILARFSAPLCDAVLESEGSQVLIEGLERENLFVVALDDERRWYRYHHLFADCLLQRLKAEEPDEIAALYRRAARWFGEHGLVAEAVQHAIAGHDAEYAAEVLEPVAIRLVNESRLALTLQWTDPLPRESLIARPSLGIARAWASLLSGNAAEADAIASALEDLPARESLIDGHLLAIRSFLARGAGDIETSGERAREALEILEDESDDVVGALSLNLGFSLYQAGDLHGAVETLERAAEVASRDAASPYVALAAMAHVGMAYMAMGRLDDAERMLRRAIELGTEWGLGVPLPAAGYAQQGLAEVLVERNRLAEAREHAAVGLELGRSADAKDVVFHALVISGWIALAENDAETLRAVVAELEPVCRDTCGKAEYGEIEALVMWNGHVSPDREDGLEWARGRAHDALEDGWNPVRTPVFRIVARILRTSGAPEEALELVSGALALAREQQVFGDAMHLGLQAALALHALGREDEALDVMTGVLELAEREGYVRTFLSEGPDLVPLLRAMVERGEHAAFAASLVRALEGSDAKVVSRAGGLAEPLTERETEVLALMAEGLTYQQAAEELYVSLNTVRSHTKSVYTKLGVNSRAEAVARATELDLL